jgi:hypothetical protein
MAEPLFAAGKIGEDLFKVIFMINDFILVKSSIFQLPLKNG